MKFSKSKVILSLAIPCLLIGNPARADWSSTSNTQVILKVDAAKGTADAVGASYSIQGNGLTAPAALNTAGAAAPAAGLTLAPTAAGVAFTLNMSTKTADTAIVTDIDNGNLPAYSDLSIDTDGTAGTLAGTVTSPTAGTGVAGGAGTTATLTQTNVYSVF